MRYSNPCLRLFVVILQDLHCLQRFYHNVDHCGIKLYHIGVGTGGAKGALAPQLFWELIYAYTAKSHGAETIRDSSPMFCAIGNPAVRARHNLDYVD